MNFRKAHFYLGDNSAADFFIVQTMQRFTPIIFDWCLMVVALGLNPESFTKMITEICTEDFECIKRYREDDVVPNLDLEI